VRLNGEHTCLSRYGRNLLGRFVSLMTVASRHAQSDVLCQVDHATPSLCMHVYTETYQQGCHGPDSRRYLTHLTPYPYPICLYIHSLSQAAHQQTNQTRLSETCHIGEVITYEPNSAGLGAAAVGGRVGQGVGVNAVNACMYIHAQHVHTYLHAYITPGSESLPPCDPRLGLLIGQQQQEQRPSRPVRSRLWTGKTDRGTILDRVKRY
jgi:hypothetical protein